MSRDLVILDHDGGVDDYLATMLLLSYRQFEPLGIVVTPGDCYINAAVSATRKLLDLMGQSHVPVARSTVRGLNPFPCAWRQAAINVDHLPALQPPGELATGLL
ncbi:MAG TPA: nucleoside hydrolase, partial [Chloroflexi bacterium]|nr:nucleoside hydrolase [Chloroflexota bacterium]